LAYRRFERSASVQQFLAALRVAALETRPV